MEIKKTLTIDDELKKKYNIVIPTQKVSEEIDKIATDLQKDYKLNGFRQGKVPLDVIKNRENAYIFGKASDNLINGFVFDFANDNKYELALQPSVNVKIMEDGKDMEFEVIYELLPNIENIDLKSIAINKYKISVGDDDINKSLEKILETYKKWSPKNGNAELGNSVKIDFLGTINGEEFPGGKAENFQLELGSHSFIDNFEDQIVGRNIGDEFEINVTFPDDYHKSSLAGKPAVFKVKVLEILEAEKKDLDDEFVKSTFGIENVDKFKEIITRELGKTYENFSNQKAKFDIIEILSNMKDFSLPESLFKKQYDNLLSAKQMDNLKNSKIEPVDEEEIKKETKKFVKVSIILSKIGKDNNIEVSDNEITQFVMKQATSNPGHEKEIIDYYKKTPQALGQIRDQIIEDKVLSYIIDNVTKNDIDTNIDDFEKLNKK